MKQSYISPKVTQINLDAEMMLAMSTDRIPVGNESKPPATNKYDNPWSSSQWEESE
jgi:hypothetical protein